MKPILLALALTVGLGGMAKADPLTLRDAICQKESRSWAVPGNAVGDGHKARGECQMWVSTARQITPWAIANGYIPAYMALIYTHSSALASMLHEPKIARAYADAYIAWMQQVKHIRGTLRLAYAWNAGPGSPYGEKPDAMSYAREVWIMLKGPPPVPGKKYLAERN